MKFINPYFRPRDKIELLQRWILVHGYIYYEMNESVVSDSGYDSNCMQLIKFINKYPKAFKESRYGYVFKEFDGSTGYDLINKLNIKDFNTIATDGMHVIDLNKRRNRNG